MESACARVNVTVGARCDWLNDSLIGRSVAQHRPADAGRMRVPTTSFAVQRCPVGHSHQIVATIANRYGACKAGHDKLLVTVLKLVQRVTLGGTDEIVLRQSANGVGHVLDAALVVADAEIWMMVLAMRDPG